MLAYVKRVQAGGVAQNQAEAHIEILNAATAQKLVTNVDIEATKADLEIARTLKHGCSNGVWSRYSRKVA